ncbi:MAG: VirB4 family type IV secretion/conjugal transfer ATPase [Gammaproteobacteria bacterium]|nr:VirB4 family type IV secretion/conjugal transfer ATPase [Gammaproteobacteria bacterium]
MSARRIAAAVREPIASRHVPYTAHLSETVVRTRQGHYVQAFRLAGAPFECADDAALDAWHERLNSLWRNLASPQLALWTHLVRRTADAGDDVRGSSRPRSIATPPSFADTLGHRYERRLEASGLLHNELFVAVIYRPPGAAQTGALRRLVTRERDRESALDRRDALEVCAKVAGDLKASLARYDPVPLGAYRDGGSWFSSLLEYFATLVNGRWQRVPLPRGPIADAVTDTRLLFGHEAIEYRGATETRVAAMIGIKEYPTPCFVGMFDKLLAVPFPLVATQSFTFLSKATAQAVLQRQFNRMTNAGDFAVTQAAELKDALDALTSNQFVMGDHHFSLQVFADPDETAPAGSAPRLKALNDRVAAARSLLADTGTVTAREDLALEAAFWAQLPGNFALRPRKAPITSRNFAAMASFHGYPVGRAHDNLWGDALIRLVTSGRTPYHFSLHAGAKGESASAAPGDIGHTLICGPTGSGKTVFIGFLLAMLHRRGVTQVVFDKDRGLEILVRALDGDYLPLASGLPTGFNPLQLPPTPGNVEFLRMWLRLLAQPAANPGRDVLAVGEQADVDRALRGTLALEPPARRLSRLIEFLDPTDPEGPHARLGRWCASTGGEYAWVFDNPEDTVVPRLSGHPIVGIDVTDFLGLDAVRAPTTAYLFHLVRALIDGRPFVCWLDEFWRLISDPAFEDFARDAPKTWRKLNAVMCLATQSASDVLASPISRTLVEQTPTKVVFPNLEANREEYVDGLGLSDREFTLIKHRLEPGSRRFLVKQSHLGVICELDLAGLERELAVISGRRSALIRMQSLIAERGPSSANWLEEFMQPRSDR